MLSRARAHRDGPPIASLAKPLVLLLPIAVGGAIPLLALRTVLASELALVGGGIGFAVFYRLVRREMSLVSAFGAYLIAISSLFVTMSGLRIFLFPPTTNLPSATLSDILLLAGGVVLIASALVERHAVPTYPGLLVVGAGMLAFAVAVTFVNPGSGGRSFDGILLLIGVIATPVAVAFATRSRTALLVVTLLWLVSGAVSGALAFLNVVGLVTSVGEVVGGRAIALSTDPNALGISLAMLMPVGMAFFLAWRNVLLRVIVTISTVCLAIGIVLSGSRAATVAALVGLVIVPVLTYRRRVQAVLLMFAVLVSGGVVYILSSGFFVSIQRLTGQLSVGDSNAARIMAWEQALGQISLNPVFGTGFTSILTAHDLALQLLVSGGAVALIGYALFAGGTVRLGVACCRTPTLDRGLSILSAGLTASVVLYLVYGAVANEIFNRFLYWPFGLLMAIFFISRRTSSVQSTDMGTKRAPAGESRAGAVRTARGPGVPVGESGRGS